ncbi:MAG: hypothetical protein WBJ62_05590 [Coriobacteriia bacterium]
MPKTDRIVFLSRAARAIVTVALYVAFLAALALAASWLSVQLTR